MRLYFLEDKTDMKHGAIYFTAAFGFTQGDELSWRLNPFINHPVFTPTPFRSE